jgi:hypothetical protein
MKKGFLHVVEALIVILLVFVVLSQFYSIPRSQHVWSEPKLRIMAQDLIYVLEEKLVNDEDWFDPVAVETAITGSIPETMGYTIKSKHDVKPAMAVGCICDNITNFNTINDDILQNVTINGFERGFTVVRLFSASFDVLSEPGDYDVLVIFGGMEMTAPQLEYLQEHLRAGGGVVQYAALTESSVEEVWHTELFNLSWTDSTRPGDSNAEMQISTPPDRAYEPIEIYSTINGDMAFVNFGTESVYPAGLNQESRIVLRQTNSYITGTLEGRSVPLAVINWGVHGNGRTAWMSDGILTAIDNRNQDMLRSLVMWCAAGKEHTVTEDVMIQSSSAKFRKIFNSDMYEAVSIEMSIGYYF